MSGNERFASSRKIITLLIYVVFLLGSTLGAASSNEIFSSGETGGPTQSAPSVSPLLLPKSGATLNNDLPQSTRSDSIYLPFIRNFGTSDTSYETQAIIRGVVRSSLDGSSLQNVTIQVEDTGFSGVTDAAGQYLIRGVPVKTITLIASGTGVVSKFLTQKIAAASDYQIDFSLELHASNQPENVQLAWFYKPPADGNLSIVANNYSSFILTRWDEEERDTLRSLGVQAPILQYLLFGQIQDPGSCTEQPHHNQVAEKIGDFCDIVKLHPDWFMRDTLGNVDATDDGYVMMDPGNAGWRNFWLERARMGQEEYGWRGVFLDNVEASLDKRYQRGAIPQNYPDDASYQAVVEDNLRFLYTNYFKPTGRPLFANIIALRNPAVWMRYMQYLDGAMMESFAVGWHDDYIKASAWETQMDLAEKTQASGKELILVSQGSQGNSKLEVFALASFLLINNGKASFRYTNSDTYDKSWMYDNYDVELGAPLGSRYKVGDTWKRDFERGQIMVNPILNTASIDVK